MASGIPADNYVVFAAGDKVLHTNTSLRCVKLYFGIYWCFSSGQICILYAHLRFRLSQRHDLF